MALIAIYPLIDDHHLGRLLLPLFLTITLLGGAVAVSEGRLRLWIGVITGTSMVITRLAWQWWPLDVLAQISLVCGVAFFFHVTLVLLHHIFTHRGSIGAEMLYGAVNVYLLIAITFTFAYALIATVDPQAFHGLPALNGRYFSSLLYFSIVTLTTLGYGDISPVSRPAAVLVTLEALCGQLYLTILVARLVGLYIAQESRDERP
ncbi:potassium channel family protein [Methylomarinovum tepidoasis]|uniref:potassium channel family protein n=1 Tax=Methylomarinovum tepidoasis TaxID=2840183 RepID=UPI00257270A4|nr:potassium channel family protein [Methylomarinovum sp. IN45]